MRNLFLLTLVTFLAGQAVQALVIGWAWPAVGLWQRLHLSGQLAILVLELGIALGGAVSGSFLVALTRRPGRRVRWRAGEWAGVLAAALAPVLFAAGLIPWLLATFAH